MSVADRTQHWNAVYMTKAESEVSWFQLVPRISLDLIARTEADPNSAIIDVGGGASRLVDALIGRGYQDVTVLDIADGALAKSRARLGADAESVLWVAADITTWTPERAYDVWHDRAVFHFLTDPAGREAYGRALRKGTRLGSQVIFGTFAPDGPERCSGLPVQRYSSETLSRQLGDDFALIEATTEYHNTPGGTVQHFQFSRFIRR